MNRIAIFWFRRDLRLNDNAGLYQALNSSLPVLPLFIFDENILSLLEDKDDARITFIFNQVERLKKELEQKGSTLIIRKGKPGFIFNELISEYKVAEVHTNGDYEPYAREREEKIEKLLTGHGILFKNYKDQVVFEKDEIVKDSGDPYTVFTPYSKKWKTALLNHPVKQYPSENLTGNLMKVSQFPIQGIPALGFEKTNIEFPSGEINREIIRNYNKTRDFPAIEGTSRLGVHLRFGTLSIRQLVKEALELNDVFLNELIWREFFMMILWHFPHVTEGAFKPLYNRIEWQNDEHLFRAWCEGRTGYPIVDAGMRQLNATGYMHNRVRMITAGFLAKHLLIDWRWGEAYFARKLLDFELASNNGGWQWAAGTGCDAAPYFRIFNPDLQAKKFDPGKIFIRKWVPEIDSDEYPREIVNHSLSRERAILAYKKALSG